MMNLKKLGMALAMLLVAAACHASTVTVFDFEDGTDGFKGKVDTSSIGATSGKSALEIDGTGLQGWQQDLAMVDSGLPDFTEAIELDLDVTVPKGVIKEGSYLQMIPTFSGPKNSFLQTSKQDLKEGLNKLKIAIKGKDIETPWKLFLILNAGGPIGGKIYVDNVRFRKPGAPVDVNITVKDQANQPVAGANVAMGSEVAVTDGGGRAHVSIGADSYKAEVLAQGVEPFSQDVVLKEDGANNVILQVKRQAMKAPLPVTVKVNLAKVIRPFDAHKLYGENIAIWNGAGPFQDKIAMDRYNEARINFLRFPGGDYGNVWNWKTGNVMHDNGTVDWSPEGNWNTFVNLMHRLPGGEMMMIANIMQMQPQDTLDWIADAKAQGVNLRYVELGNEPDLKPTVPHGAIKGEFWTRLDNYNSEYLRFAKAIRAKYPDIKLMGPCISQIEYRECPNGKPWECRDDKTKRFWIEEFIRRCGAYCDVVSFHSYPYYDPNGALDPAKFFDTTNEFRKWIPMWRGWIKKYQPARASKIEIAMTEYNCQVAENATTASLWNGVYLGNFLAEFVKNGGDIANYWDLETTKQGEGGGHGMLDIAADPNRAYAQRATYWTMKMMANGFTGKIVDAFSNAVNVPVYAAVDTAAHRTSLLVVNRNADQGARVTFSIPGVKGQRMTIQQLSGKQYQWSKQLYRAVVNSGPSSVVYGVPKSGAFSLPFEPLSVSVITIQ